MAFVLKDRVKETSTTTGTGTFTLGGASPGYQGFSTVGNANTTFYSIVMGTEWENGVGTYTSSGSALSRDTVLSSSNSGNLVNFSAGTKDVFINYPAGRAAAYDTPSQSTGAFHVTVGTTAQRPTGAVGMIRYNTTESQNEVYNGSDWKYFAQASYPYSVEYLVIAGGGGGGWDRGGGGGAGGFRTASGFSLSSGTQYTVTVGAGGAGGTGSGTSNPGLVGNNSVFSTITSNGGGGGSNAEGPDAGSGGSGAGAAGSPCPATGGSGTAGQGNNGGDSGVGGPNYGAAGGGGAGATGSNGATGSGGNGGNGTASSISGSSVTYAGGGGGGTYDGGTVGNGGSGGGGNAGASGGGNGSSGTANTGGGGGGGSTNGSATVRGTGGAGGSGIVIIRYLGAQRGTGGTVTSSGGYTIHTFTTSGTYTA
jgi:hypothetical protein